MDDCCNNKATELTSIATKQRIVLWIVLLINFTMFFIESFYGWLSKSTSLQADALDMLGDTFVYGFSLFAIGRSLRWNASVSLLKGVIMASFGLGVLAQATHRFTMPILPIAETMGWVGTLALVANVICAALLLRHRNDNLNMRSTWLCSRNDVIANVGVLLAAGAVAYTQSKMPDLVVGTVIALLVLKSSFTVLKESYFQLRQPSV